MQKLVLALALIPMLSGTPSAAKPAFVRVNGTRLELAGKPYRFLGANLWTGMNLGSLGPGGDRARLIRELDRLQALGVTNLRILGASEGPDTEPWRVTPALTHGPEGDLDPALLGGLDFLLARMAERDMRAVVVLTNFWPWSGGMAQYLAWFGAGPIPYPPPQPGGDWGAYQSYARNFYRNEGAVAAYESVVRRLVARYADNPAIMAWELANEPRGITETAAFGHWIERTSDLIKTIDPNHLVTTGSEGETPSPSSAGLDFVANHRYRSIDYATLHIWAQNWGWFDPARPATLDGAIVKMRAYFQDHLAKARLLGKPMVLEEFGLSRDGGSFDPSSRPRLRDRYYAEVFALVEAAMRADAPVAGVNFWAWAGEARPRTPAGGAWRPGDPLLGDPPHEPQGWYSVYDSDTTTLGVISRFAKRIKNP